MKKTYRQGAFGALMDEYERAATDIIKLLKKMDIETYTRILDSKTKDKDCRSVQTIMNHVVRASYGYANYIREQFNEPFVKRKTDYKLATPAAVIDELNKALKYTEETLSNKWNMPWKEISTNIIHTKWGQHFDIDQLLEHAVVHILRHRRQIERLLQSQRSL